MTECQVCNSKLVTDGLNSGQQIRCANCQSLSRFGKVEKVATDRLAWRSFWLGISSILLLSITGIPAIYYGIRSLLRMRFIKPVRRDRAAAIIGTTLGGCLGVFVGFIAIFSLILALIHYWTFTETHVESEVAQQCSLIFEFSSPHVVPVRATSSMNSQRLFDFADKTEFDDRTLMIRLAFVRVGLQPNDAVMTNQLKKKRLGAKSFGPIHKSEFLDWQLNGQPIHVKKSVFSRTLDSDLETDSTAETHRQYWGYIRVENGLFGMAVVYDPARCELTESDVQEIFAATRVK